MSRDRFDVLDRFESLFQLREPSFERFLRRRDRKRRNQRVAAGAVGIGVFVATIWVVTSVGISDRGRTIGGSAPTSVPNVDGIGIIGLPPEDARPSLPARGELVVGFLFGHTDGDQGRFSLHLYADGRVVWQRLSSERDAGLIQQRLTPEGVQLVRSEVLATGFFYRDVDREVVGPLGGLHFGSIEVRTDRLERMSWGGVSLDDARSPVESSLTPDDVLAIERLDARLEDLGSWLPAGAWEQREPKPFVASRYSVCLETDRGGLETAIVTLPRPASDQLRRLGWTHQVIEPSPAGSPINVWCSFVTTDDARALARAIDDAGTASSVRRDVFGLGYAFERRDASTADVKLTFEPALPDQP
jgi:hypothetical protein